MAMKEVYPHTDKLIQYDKIIEIIPGIERKGLNLPYTSLNGNMFSWLDKEGTCASPSGKGAYRVFEKVQCKIE